MKGKIGGAIFFARFLARRDEEKSTARFFAHFLRFRDPITDACPALKTCRFRSLNRHVPPGGIAKGLEFAFVHRQRRRVARKLLRQSRNIPISCYRPRKTSAGLRAASAAPMPRTVVGAAHPPANPV
jgi:hypothetical protein